MVGIKGKPFTESFEWVRWSRSSKRLEAMGATEILTDGEAKRRGFVVAAAKAVSDERPNNRAPSLVAKREG